MAVDGSALVAQFRAGLGSSGVADCGIVHEAQPAPHQPHGLPKGKGVVYVFSICEDWGARCEAGPHRVLKVGKAGANSDARFRSQHYKPGRALSSLAASLVNREDRWEYLGVERFTSVSVESWIRMRLDRDNFYFPGEENMAIGLFESFLHARLNPLFEGR